MLNPNCSTRGGRLVPECRRDACDRRQMAQLNMSAAHFVPPAIGALLLTGGSAVDGSLGCFGLRLATGPGVGRRIGVYLRGSVLRQSVRGLAGVWRRIIAA